MSARWKRTMVGEVKTSPDDPKSFYIKFVADAIFKAGDTVSLQSKQQQIDSATDAFNNGKLSEELLTKITERVNNIPEFVKFQVIKLSKEEA